MRRAIASIAAAAVAFSTAGYAMTGSASADDPRADITSITLDTPNASYGSSCQYVNVTAVWSIQPGNMVGNAFASLFVNGVYDGAAYLNLDPTDGDSTAHTTLLYCPDIDGVGSLFIGDTSVSIHAADGDYSTTDTTVSNTVTYGTAPTPPPPTPPVTPPIVAPAPVVTPPPVVTPLAATSSRLVVSRPDAGSELDFDVYTKVGAHDDDQPVVHIQQRVAANTWATIATVSSTDGYASYVRHDKYEHAYRLVVPIDNDDAYSANTSAVVVPVVTGARPATSAEKKALTHAFNTSTYSGVHGETFKLANERVSTTNRAWAEASVLDPSFGSMPAIFHYQGKWKTVGQYSCEGLGMPAQVKIDLGEVCE